MTIETELPAVKVRLREGTTTAPGCHSPTCDDVDKADVTMSDALAHIYALERRIAEARAAALEEAANIAANVHAPKSIGRDHGRHHEAGAQHAARLIRALIPERKESTALKELGKGDGR